MKKEYNPITFFKTKKYVKEKKNEKYYPNFGLETYVGQMGGGKTISATKRILDILEKYPKLILISNVKIKWEKYMYLKTKEIINVIYFNNSEELVNILKEIDQNNTTGYLIFIDEIHVVLAELFGKSDPIFLQFLSQQRKLSIHIIATSQMFNKLPKFIRDYLMQSGQVVVCKNIFKYIQLNKWVDMESIKENSKGELEFFKCKIKCFIHTKELYEVYDTYAVISQIQGLMKGSLTYGSRLSTNNEPTSTNS